MANENEKANKVWFFKTNIILFFAIILFLLYAYEFINMNGTNYPLLSSLFIMLLFLSIVIFIYIKMI